MAGLYIHIPFCAKRCIYCDFYSNTDIGYKNDYISALIREMEIRYDYLNDKKIETIYFGGGTPSQLHCSDFERLFDAMYRLYTIADNPEVTIEANPDDLSGDYVASLRTFPFNRISIGIQSFIDDELLLLNRRHTAIEAIDAVNCCKNAGMTNISIDLMYGLPCQTPENWQFNVDKAVELNVSHISAYNLSYEEGTTIYKMKENGEVQLVDDEMCESFFCCLVKKLTDAGFVHYEVSNFARRSSLYPEGMISLHNSSYWNGTHYIGLGASAHSYNGHSRSWNISSINEYIKGINDKNVIPCETEYLDERMRYNDFIITRLRTMWGVSSEELKREFGEERERYFFEKSEMFLCLSMLKKQDGYVKVSSGSIFTSDAIIRELIAL